MNLACKLCGKIKPLIKAHVIPRSFYAANTYIISNDLPYIKRRPIGSYDSNILCQQCDSIELGRLDDLAKKILIDKKGIIKETIHHQSLPWVSLNYYRLKDKSGYDKLIKFFISVLWRASVSNHEDFASFSLGLYEKIAKRALLDESYDFHSSFSIALCFLPNLKESYNRILCMTV